MGLTFGRSRILYEDMHTQDPFLASLRIANDGVPIYVQLREQFVRAIASGVLRPGDQMPTMRQVAVALKVDLNTVRHAYDELERQGAVVLVRGRGSFIADAPPSATSTEPDHHPVEKLARQSLDAARAHGVDPRAVADLIHHLSAQQELKS